MEKKYRFVVLDLSEYRNIIKLMALQGLCVVGMNVSVYMLGKSETVINAIKYL